MDSTAGMNALMTLAGVVVAFFLLRRLVLWYWKVEDALRALRQQRDLLTEIRDALRALTVAVSAAPESPGGGVTPEPPAAPAPGVGRQRVSGAPTWE